MAMLIGVLPFSAFAAKTSGKCGKNAKWSYNAKTATLTISGKGDISNLTDVYGDKRVNVVIKNGITRIKSIIGVKMKSLKLPDSLKEIDSILYCEVPATITIPKSVTKIESSFLNLSYGVKQFKVAKGNKSFMTKDGVLFTKDGKTLVTYPSAKKQKSYTVPNTVTKIGDICPEQGILGKVIVPASVKSIPGSISLIPKIYFQGKPPAKIEQMFPYAEDEDPLTIYYPESLASEWSSAIKKIKSAWENDGGYAEDIHFESWNG